MNASNRSACDTFSKEEFTTIMATKISTSAVSFVACVLTLILVCCLRMWKTFVHRLTLYLTAVAILLSVMYILQVLPITSQAVMNQTLAVTEPRSDGWSKACEGIAFLHQYTIWVMLLVICWIIVFLLYLTHHSLLGKGNKKIVSSPKLMEATGIIFTMIFPFTFLWVPFVTDNYGVGGAWCGIAIKHNSCSHESLASGVGIQVGIWYGPAFATALLCTVGVFVVIYRICHFYYKMKRHRQQKNYLTDIIIDGIPLIIYLVVFNVINLVNATNLIYYAISDNNNSKINMKLWIIHSFAGPARALMIPFAFVLGQFIKHVTRWFKKRESATTIFRVSTEWTDVDPLIIRQESTNQV